MDRQPAEARPAEAQPTEPLPTTATEALPLAEPGWCLTTDWCWVYPTPHGNDLEGVWAFAEDNAWAVGENATIIHWDGEGWSPVDIGLPPELDLHDVWSAGPERIFVAADDGSVWSFDGRADAASSVERHEPPGSTRPLRSLWGSSERDLYALTHNSGYAPELRHYDGVAWSHVAAMPLDVATIVQGSAADDVFVFGHSDVAHFDGRRWQTQVTPTLRRPFSGAWFGAIDGHPRVIAVGEDDQFLIHDGHDWTAGVTTHGLATDVGDAADTLTAVTVMAGGEIYGGTGLGNVLVWKDDRWSVVAMAADRFGDEILDLASAGDLVFAVGRRGKHLVIRRGEIWTAPLEPSRHATLGIAGLDEHVWLLEPWHLLHFDGREWTSHPQTKTRALWPIGPDEVHLVGEYGYRRLTGETLTAASMPVSDFVGEDIWASGPNNVWIAARDHLLHFDGVDWRARPLDIEAWSIHGTELDNLLVTGLRKQPRADMPGRWVVARRHRGIWTIELEGQDAAIFLRAHGAEGGVAIDLEGRAWLRDDRGWHAIPPVPRRGRPRSYEVVGLWMHGPNAIWAVDKDGVASHFDGEQWRIETANLGYVTAMSGTDSHLLVTNDEGSVFRRELPLR